MPKQPAIPGLRYAMKKKVTRRKMFLMEMDAVVPWTRLLALIEPHYPKVGPKGGRPPMPLETMLRIYFLQSWYALSDPMAEESLYDSEAMRRFAGIELGDDRIPDETTILNFRHLLEKHQLTEKLFAEVNAYGIVSTRVLAASPGHPVLVRAMELALEAIRRQDGDMSWSKTGPRLLTCVVAAALTRGDPPGSGGLDLLPESALRHDVVLDAQLDPPEARRISGNRRMRWD